MTNDWRGPVNQLLFSLKFSQEISDEAVRWSADNAVRYVVFELSPEMYYESISKALASGEHLDGLGQLPQFNQAEIADFLSAVNARLDELRPWPEPKFRQLDDLAPWDRFRHAASIARLDASIVEVTDVLQKGFRPVGDSQPGLHILMLKLATGETVALLGSYGREENVTLHTDSAGVPADVIEHFIAATGFPADKVTRI